MIVFLRRILSWMQRRGGKLASAACWLEHRGRAKSARIKRSELLGLYLFVAIPLPGTGAWTGALVAALLGRRLSHAMLSIGAGVTTACCIVALLCKASSISQVCNNRGCRAAASLLHFPQNPV